MPFSSHRIRKLIRYTTYSTAVFIPEYALFLLLLEYTPFHYVTITIGTFIFGITLQYALVRYFVFSDTIRHWETGFMLFFTSSCVGVGIVVLSMLFFVEILNIPRSIARVLAGMIGGYLVYLFNVYETFKQPKEDHSPSAVR